MQNFEFTQDTAHGRVEIQMRREGETFVATCLLPTGSELDLEIETSNMDDALSFIEDSVNFWAETSEDTEPVDLSDPLDTPWS